MAININDTLEIRRKAAEVFAYLIDVSNDPKWQHGLEEAKYTSEGPVCVGATGVHRARVLGRTVEIGWELTEYEESRRAGWRFISGPFAGNQRVTLQSTPSGTKLIHTAKLQLKGLTRLLGPIAGGMLSSQSRRNLQHLKRILESQ